MPTIRQWPLWGTKAWQKLYGRRSAVETLNNLIRANGRRRGYTRVLGKNANELLLHFMYAAVNIHEARKWRILHQQPSLDGPEDETDDELATCRDTAAAREADDLARRLRRLGDPPGTG